MSNVVEVSPTFKREIKSLVKKFRSLKDSIEILEKDLIENPYLGSSYGSGIYKVRLADESKGSGKSGGFRVLYYHLRKTSDGIVILLTNIYDKSERGTITKRDAVKQLTYIVKEHQANKP